ncbi:hypothetical protein GIB67_009998 [Kingdonia uniflora]|uniref:Uncharacterized protein n=1 Tax=Kingdonia uniflora TaxID=39325 RepID=A0A7J7P1M1_9MAGN|nr:hypothetical protein GIB67_009998 [Kingdonia uniflora]
MDRSGNNNNNDESLVTRIQQLEHERDALHKDIEQMCLQQAGPSYLVIATRMHFQRTAGLEQEIESLKKKLTACTRDNLNLQEELSEVYRIKSQMADLHDAEVSKNIEAEKQVKFFQGCVAAAFSERDHSLMEAEKAKEKEEAISYKLNDLQKRHVTSKNLLSLLLRSILFQHVLLIERLEEFESVHLQEKKLQSTLQIDLMKLKEQNANFDTTSVDVVEIARLEAGVVTEDSKKFDGDDLEMKHLEEMTEREVHRAIDLVGGKDEDVSKSFRSKFDEEVATLMREVHMINDFQLSGSPTKEAQPQFKPLSRIRKTIGGELFTSPTTEERSPVTKVAEIQEREVPIAVLVRRRREIEGETNQGSLGEDMGMPHRVIGYGKYRGQIYNRHILGELMGTESTVEEFAAVVIMKFYNIRQRSLGVSDNLCMEDKCQCLLTDAPEVWSFDSDREISSSQYIDALEKELAKLRISADNVQNKLRVGLEIENHLRKNVHQLKEKKIVSDDLIKKKISELRDFHSNQRIEVMNVLEQEDNQLKLIFGVVQEKIKEFHVNKIHKFESLQTEKDFDDIECRDVHITVDTSPSPGPEVTISPLNNMTDGVGDTSQALEQALCCHIIAPITAGGKALTGNECKHCSSGKDGGATEKFTTGKFQNLSRFFLNFCFKIGV